MSLYDSLMEKMKGKEYSDYFMCLCPFKHDGRYEQNPSMMVHDDGFHCKGCHKRGSLKFLAKVVGANADYSPEHKAKVLPQFKRWMERDGDVQEIAYQAHKFLRDNKSYQGYLKERKLLDFLAVGMFGFRDGWITIPVRDQKHKIINLVCRGISKEKTRYVLMQLTDKPILYSPCWDLVTEQEPVYVPFGIFDSWAMYAIGKASVTGTTGTSLSADLLKPLEKTFVVVPDKGEEREAYHLINHLGWRGDIKKLSYPDGTKDVDEIRRKFGNKKLIQLLEA